MKDEYNRDWFKQFRIVLNALDNRQARNHVNRMCLAAQVPLVESGTAGYLGQATVIMKNKFECYECNPKPTQKTFPGCTIRNTPSETIHCIVWAKHLFNQLFGEAAPSGTRPARPSTALSGPSTCSISCSVRLTLIRTCLPTLRILRPQPRVMVTTRGPRRRRLRERPRRMATWRGRAPGSGPRRMITTHRRFSPSCSVQTSNTS